MTGRAISPQTAAALCVKPRGQMTARQAASVDALRRVRRVHNHAALGDAVSRRTSQWNDGEVGCLADRCTRVWDLRDAAFAKTIRQDLEAVRNAVSEPWSNGQTEGQINKLKTLKRAMQAAPASLCSALA